MSVKLVIRKNMLVVRSTGMQADDELPPVRETYVASVPDAVRYMEEYYSTGHHAEVIDESGRVVTLIRLRN